MCITRSFSCIWIASLEYMIEHAKNLVRVDDTTQPLQRRDPSTLPMGLVLGIPSKTSLAKTTSNK
jgi:hypothetical protein